MELIKIQDAAIVTWPQDKDKPKTKQQVKTASSGDRAAEAIATRCAKRWWRSVMIFGLRTNEGKRCLK
jgi:hypothetical protein